MGNETNTANATEAQSNAQSGANTEANAQAQNEISCGFFALF